MTASTNRPALGIVIEYVPDVEAATRFYTDVIGLEIERHHPTFVQFKESSGARFAIASDEPLTGGGERELYWFVDDVEATQKRLASQAEVVRPLTAMPFGKVFGIEGPAGKPQLFLQLADERPSEAVG